MKAILFSLFAAALLLPACESNTADNLEDGAEAVVDENPMTAPEATGITEIPAGDGEGATATIATDGFLGLEPGALLADYDDRLTESTLETGEGSFTVYEVRNDENTVMGYVVPDPRDATRMGDIVITSPYVRTSSGMTVNMTYGELEETVGIEVVHGSEIESRTYATGEDGLQYRLDIPFGTYEVDPRNIPRDTRITEIVISR